eukprot:2831856-Rhodomonas_salina.1
MPTYLPTYLHTYMNDLSLPLSRPPSIHLFICDSFHPRLFPSLTPSYLCLFMSAALHTFDSSRSRLFRRVELYLCAECRADPGSVSPSL